MQSRGQEIIDALRAALQGVKWGRNFTFTPLLFLDLMNVNYVSSDALKAYLKYNNSLPSRIIVYRDGVGDGMLQSVVDYEVPQIMQSIKTMGADYE